jgi:hypothetical protein
MQVLMVLWMLAMGTGEVVAERGLDALGVLSVGVADLVSTEGPLGPPPPRPLISAEGPLGPPPPRP